MRIDSIKALFSLMSKNIECCNYLWYDVDKLIIRLNTKKPQLANANQKAEV